MKKWLASGIVLASIAVGASSCSDTIIDGDKGEGCTWMSDESSLLKDGYTVVVSLCIDDGGNVVDLDVE